MRLNYPLERRNGRYVVQPKMYDSNSISLFCFRSQTQNTPSFRRKTTGLLPWDDWSKNSRGESIPHTPLLAWPLLVDWRHHPQLLVHRRNTSITLYSSTFFFHLRFFFLITIIFLKLVRSRKLEEIITFVFVKFFLFFFKKNTSVVDIKFVSSSRRKKIVRE